MRQPTQNMALANRGAKRIQGTPVCQHGGDEVVRLSPSYAAALRRYIAGCARLDALDAAAHLSCDAYVLAKRALMAACVAMIDTTRQPLILHD